jgi:signal transduction histidine kinase
MLGMTVILANVYRPDHCACAAQHRRAILQRFSRAIRRAQHAHTQNQRLAQELEEANQKLQNYTTQLEQLAVARERNRLARDLHDSVTQTVFSMTLTTQSAVLLLERDPDKVEVQLERLSQLARSALAEMQLLITELKPSETTRGGLAATLKRYLASERFSDGLSISLDVQGERSLRPSEEQSLSYCPGALNNIVKRAGNECASPTTST